ncbi:MAG: serine hydrolase [Planctomycetes bacterium]|nr:serine hydrolase [Planctomycetota bacterium]
MYFVRFMSLAVLVCAWLGVSTVDAGRIKPVYPQEKWVVKKPDAVGLDVRKLDALSRYSGGFGCVVRHGYMVYTWGDASRRKDVASAVKPLYTHFLLKAVEDGKIKSIDEPVYKVEPRLRGLNKNLGYKDREITWRHLCNQISCYGVRERPGRAFDYSDWNMALLFDSLFVKVYGTSWEKVDSEVLSPGLTDLLGCEDKPTFMAFGTGDRPGRLAISPRDFARFGLLYLRKGKWNGKQLIDAETAAAAVSTPLPISIPRTKGAKGEMIKGQRSIGGGNNQCDHNGNYSFAWWINGLGRDGTRNWPDAATDVYGCFGHGDIRAMVVMPSLDLIVSWNDSKIKGHAKVNEALKLIGDAVQKPQVNSGQIIVDPKNPRWLKRQGNGALFMCGPGDPEGFLYRGKLNADGTRNGDQMQLIEKLKPTGANCIYLMAVRSHGGDGDKTHNPFVGHDPARGLNAKLLDQWEQWFDAMDEAQIVIYFFIYDDSARIWNTGDVVGADEKVFLRGLVDRFEHHRNLIWCVAEEYAERLSARRVSSIAAVIRAADDNDHAIAVHKNNGLDFAEFADDANIDQFAIQYNVGTAEELHAGMVKAYSAAKGRYSLNMSECADNGTGKELRLRNWACAMGGAYVMVLDMDIASTPQSDLADCGRLVRFFESTDFDTMSPHDELAFAATKYVLARPGKSYIAYSPNSDGKIGLRNVKAGTYDFRWFDCATGKEVVQTGLKVAASNQSWPTPSGIGTETAVYIKRVGQ